MTRFCSSLHYPTPFFPLSPPLPRESFRANTSHVFPDYSERKKKEKMEKSRADRWSQFVRSHFLSSGKGKTFSFSTDISPFYFYFPEVGGKLAVVGDRIKLRRLNGAEKEMGKSSHYAVVHKEEKEDVLFSLINFPGRKIHSTVCQEKKDVLAQKNPGILWETAVSDSNWGRRLVSSCLHGSTCCCRYDHDSILPTYFLF